MEKQKYFVLFIPSFQSVREARGRKLNARENGKDEFTYKQALKIKQKLIRRGDKSVVIKKL